MNASAQKPVSRMLFGAAQFGCPKICREARDRFGTIRYTAAMSDTEGDQYIFWGPYVELQEGVYIFTLHGQLDGELMAEFACDQGMTILKHQTLIRLSTPVCLILEQPVKDLELRAAKSPKLRSLLLTALSISCAHTVSRTA